MRLIGEGLAVAPQDQALLALQAAVQQAIEAKRLRKEQFGFATSLGSARRAQFVGEPTKPPPGQQEIAALLAKAQEQIKGLKLTRPRGDNAYESFRAVLEIDPDNPEAHEGLLALRDQLQAAEVWLHRAEPSMASERWGYVADELNKEGLS